MSEPVPTLMGWCQTHGRPDQYHALCRREITTAQGVRIRCSCPNHDPEDTDALPERG